MIHKNYIIEEYIIYVYEDEINHCAYVGLTNNKKRRDYEHLMNKADSLYKYCRKYDIPVPEMKVLIENLSATEAQKEEKWIWYKYRDEGWTMINSEKSLGYLGTSAKYLKKVKLQITKILEEHPEIKTKELLKIISEDAYDLVRRLNMFKEFFK